VALETLKLKKGEAVVLTFLFGLSVMLLLISPALGLGSMIGVALTAGWLVWKRR